VSDMPPLIDLDGVSVSLPHSRSGRIRILNDLTFRVCAGDFLTILGPSGSGKSTLLRVLAGLLAPTSGSLKWKEELLGRRGQAMAISFQKPVLLPWRTVEENILFPYRISNIPVDQSVVGRFEKLLSITKLTGFRGASPDELSGGMQMRTAFARALITEPELILMDEPFSALDELTREALAIELREMIQQMGVSVVFVTHSISEAVFLSSRVIVLSHRPAQILKEVSIDLPERSVAVKRSQQFLDYCEDIRHSIGPSS